MEDGVYKDTNPNIPEEYLATVQETMTRKKGEKKGHNVKQNYGSTKGENNKMSSERGINASDEEKLKAQALPNTRMYTYVE